MGETQKAKKERVRAVTEILAKTYPKAKIVLRYGSTWELLVAVILSAQCTDVMVNKVTERLFEKYPSLDTYVQADVAAFEQAIKSTGFYHNKAKNILASAKLVQEKFSGKVPDTMEKLLTLPGVARKTANVILGNAFGKTEGIAVDTHVQRLSQRLRLVDMATIGGKKELTFTRHEKPVIDYKKDADPVKIEQQLMALLPKEEWFQFTYRVIDHGRAICKAQSPDCGHCVLKKLCPSFRA